MLYVGLCLFFGLLAWVSWNKSVRDADLLFAALAFIFATVCLLIFYGIVAP